jgi:hypothetical protein
LSLVSLPLLTTPTPASPSDEVVATSTATLPATAPRATRKEQKSQTRARIYYRQGLQARSTPVSGCDSVALPGWLTSAPSSQASSASSRRGIILIATNAIDAAIPGP